MFEKLLAEMSLVMATAPVRAPVPRVEEGWDDELAAFALAWLSTELGESFLAEALVTPDTMGDFGLKIGSFFVPPGFVTGSPFPDAKELWWSAVKDILADGKAFSLDADGKPDAAKPNYGAAVSVWKNKIEEKYGYRPSASKEKTFAQGVEDGIKAAAKMMRSKMVDDKEVTPEMRSKAARTLQAKKTAGQKARKAVGEARAAFAVGQTVVAKEDTYIGIGRDASHVSKGTKAKITDEGEDDDGHFWFLSIKITPGRYADSQEPWTMTKSVSDKDLEDEWKRG